MFGLFKKTKKTEEEQPMTDSEKQKKDEEVEAKQPEEKTVAEKAPESEAPKEKDTNAENAEEPGAEKETEAEEKTDELKINQFLEPISKRLEAIEQQLLALTRMPKKACADEADKLRLAEQKFSN